MNRADQWQLPSNTLPDVVDSVALQDVLNKFMNRADQWQLPSNTLPDVVDSVALQGFLNKFMNRADQWHLQAAGHNCSELSHGNYCPSKYY